MISPVLYHALTWQERKTLREQYITHQNGNCLYCGESLSKNPPSRITDKLIDWSYFPPNFLKYPVHLQHNHITDMTEGAVHAYCNAVMWQYENQ